MVGWESIRGLDGKEWGKTYVLKSESKRCESDEGGEYYAFEYARALIKSGWMVRGSLNVEQEVRSCSSVIGSSS